MTSLVETIVRKREGKALSTEEVSQAIGDYASGRMPDYQMAALLMAICIRGLSGRELRDLTRAMIASGETYDLSAIPGPKVDKHSTGGVGDKISLALAPLVASAGVAVPMVAGRGLGHTGGTIDKLESIPGFRVRLSKGQFLRQLETAGCVIATQSARLVPADRKLYALRDVTGTVESIPLIAASILSKKVASGNDALVMDVKVGSGAFKPSLAQARELARTLVALGKSLGMRICACLTDMSQPLGRAVGNALEVREAIEVLQGGGPPDHIELLLDLGARMLLMGKAAPDMESARAFLQENLASGEAFERFLAMVEAQGGDPRTLERPDRLPVAREILAVRAERAGWIAKINCRAVGLAACQLGAGRQTLADKIDHGVGLIQRKKIGERVQKGEAIWAVHARQATPAHAAAERLRTATVISSRPAAAPKLIREYLR